MMEPNEADLQILIWNDLQDLLTSEERKECVKQYIQYASICSKNNKTDTIYLLTYP